MAFWGIAFVLILTGIVVAVAFVIVFAIRGLLEHQRQSSIGAYPVRSGAAHVIDKRADVHGTSNYHATSYFATFELSDGQRVEVSLTGEQSGLLAIGDAGTLTWQGPTFHSFQRALMR